MMTELHAKLVPTKLPLDNAIRVSYAWFFRQFPDLLRMSWPWLLVCAVLKGLSSWINFMWPDEAFIPPPSRPPALVITTTCMNLLPLIAAASIAVAWHRRIMLDEQPGLSCSNLATPELWRTIMAAIELLVVAFAVPYAIILSIAYLSGSNLNIHSDSIVLVFVLFLAILVAGIIVALRFALLLPARAVGHNELSFAQAWRRTRGNSSRLFWGFAYCTLPPVILLGIVKFLLIKAIWSPKSPLSALDVPHEPGLLVISSAAYAGYMLTVPLGAGFLSQAYRHFVEGTDIASESREPLSPHVISG
jgi:hypothetical protein